MCYLRVGSMLGDTTHGRYPMAYSSLRPESHTSQSVTRSHRLCHHPVPGVDCGESRLPVLTSSVSRTNSITRIGPALPKWVVGLCCYLLAFPLTSCPCNYRHSCSFY